MALIAANSQASCLLGRTILPPDAEVTPLTPPSIVHEIEKTSPLPGTIILLPSVPANVTFRVTVARGNSDPLIARWFIDRARPCNNDPPGCQEQPQQSDPAEFESSDGGIERTLTATFAFRDLGRCTRLDLYIAPEFKSGPFFRHLPVRDGDSVHARWFIVTRGTEGYPPVEDCAKDTVVR